MNACADSLLLVLPVPFRHQADGSLLIEKQACNGLDRWADNFQRLIVACPVQPANAISRRDSSSEYVSLEQLGSRDRIEFVPLPWAYRLSSFIQTYQRTRRLLADKIRSCEYLSFAIGGLVGDWASVAAMEASRQGRRFSVWTDRVEHRVVRKSYTDRRGLRRIYSYLRDNLATYPLMKMYEKHIIRKCNLGLFHGRDCFDEYSKICQSPHLVHNIHLKPSDTISPQETREKIERIRSGAPLRIYYAGRAAGMKGPLDWIEAMRQVRLKANTFVATWAGDGPLLDDMRAAVRRLNLGEAITLPGFIADRQRLLESMRGADIFVFCHLTDESPRCLIEALMSGCPTIGYSSPYSRDILGSLAEPALVPRHDVNGLAEKICYYNANRAQLAELVEASRQIGAGFSDEAVFRHRSDLIKAHLGVREHTPPSGIAGSERE